MAETVDTSKFKKAGALHDRRRRRLHEQLVGRVLPPAHPLGSLAAQGREGRDRHRRRVQPGQAGRRHRGPDRQEREPDHLLAGRREGDPAGAREGRRQGHPDRKRRRRLHLLGGHGRERLHRPVRARRDGGAALRRPISAARARSSRCCRSPAPPPRSISSPRSRTCSRSIPTSSCSRPSTATGTAPRPSRSPRTCCSAIRRSTASTRPPGQMSMGVVEAFEEAGRAKGLVMSPGDEYNGWMKWVVKNKKGGAVTFPTRAGQEATKLGLKILAGQPVPHGLVIPSQYIAPSRGGQVRRDGQARRLVGEQRCQPASSRRPSRALSQLRTRRGAGARAPRRCSS